MIHINGISLNFGDRALFDDISLSIEESDRVGLVGRNGSGKSTLLKVINNPSMLDEGSIAIPKGKKVAYMPQEVVLLSDKTILEEAFSGHERMMYLQKLTAELELVVQQDHSNTKAIDQLIAAHEELAFLEPDQAMAQTKRVLNGLGFKTEIFDNPVSSLSVGWKMRIVLAKLLLQKADFYLFDEPTNHLDIIAKDWFIDFLQNASFGFMLVCHERYLMEKLCTTIFEIELGHGKRYNMRYSAYEIQKEHDIALLKSQHTQQQKDIKRKKETIDRFRASASKSAMAKSMEKALDKIELIELPPSPKSMHFTFKEPIQSGRIVLKVENVAHAFDDKQLFKNVNFDVERAERVALIAPNGVGKTTLFNLIVGNLPLQHGSIEFGHNVLPTIFHQDQHAVFDLEDTVFNNVLKKTTNKTDAQVRAMLGSFLFVKDDVNKPFKVLSGGEKNRVAMATVLLQDANFLLLDEPTNHLDIYAKDVLLNALKSYKGTLLFVSHDHDFINGLATRIIELTPDGACSYLGNYSSYQQHQKDRELLNKTDTGTQKKVVQQPTAPVKEVPKKSDDARKQIQKLEGVIDKLEKQIAKQEELFAAIAWGTKEYDAAHATLVALKKELAVVVSSWEEALR